MASLPMLQANNWTFRKVVGITLLLVSVVLAFWLLYRFYLVLFILFFAILMGTVIRPVVTWLNRHGLHRTAGVILVFLILLALLIGFLLLLFPLVLEQGTTIAAAVPDYYQSFREWMVNSPNQFIFAFSEFLPPTLPTLDPTPQTGQDVLASAEQALGYASKAVEVFFLIIVILALTFFWTLDGPRIIQSLLQLIPEEKRESIGALIADMESKIVFFLAGQGVLCVIIGVMALIAYLIIGLPNALVLALMAGALEAIPMVGPLLGAVPAALIALSISPSMLIWVIVASVIIQLLENNFLVPRIMRKAVGVNPFVSLLAIFAFSSLFGVAGALMAIPMAAIIQLLLDRFVFHPAAQETEISTGRDHASRMRYKAQDLAQDLRKQARFKKWGTVLKVKQVDKVMDEIESITTDLDALLAQVTPTQAP